MIDAIEVQHYKGFRANQKLPLSQWTLLYGENNCGKSALLRLVPLLAGSMQHGAGLNLGHPALRGASFQSLLFGHDAGPEMLLGLELSQQNTPSERWAWSLEWREQHDMQVIRELRNERDGNQTVLTWAPSARKEDGRAGTYLVEGGGSVQVEWKGLAPSSELLETSMLSRFATEVAWLTNVRTGPNRNGVVRGATYDECQQGGLAAEAACARHSDMVNEVSRWYEENVGLALHITQLEHRNRFRLRSTGSASADLAFDDVGEGLQQVFPVLVALERLRSAGGVLCLEEPESHLHPRLQRALGRRVAEVLLDQPNAQVLMETHSEVLLYEALLYAATSLRERVAIAWLATDDGGSCSARPVPLDGGGRPLDDTLSQAFSALGVLRREVIEARRNAN